MNSRISHGMAAVLVAFLVVAAVEAADREAPPGMFRDLDDESLGNAVLVHSKQLFIDDFIIEEIKGARKALNHPVKHHANPLIVRDHPWEELLSYGTVLYDEQERQYRMWYQFYQGDVNAPTALLGYAQSQDGVRWEKPLVNTKEQNNIVFAPQPPATQVVGIGVYKDVSENDPQRRYKMLYNSNSDGSARSWSTNAAYSPDGLHWSTEPQNPLIPLSDTQNCFFWDVERQRYVAYVRYGPPNTRMISRIESEDFVAWSPKITVLRPGKLDEPFQTQFYGMRVMPYDGVYLGLLCTYHGETTKPIPDDKLWMDRKNVQLAFSRNGVTWQRVGSSGAIPGRELHSDRDWAQEAENATFLPYGEFQKDWDWGVVYPLQPPLVVGDEIRIYYQGQNARNWWNFHGDPIQDGFGLATLRLDGFVSVEDEGDGTLTTRPLVFIGDTLVVNADAAGGSLSVEALDADGKSIDAFGASDCTLITTDSVRHMVEWNGSSDCYLLQGRPIQLRFHMKSAKLYSFEPRVRHKHYLPSFD